MNRWQFWIDRGGTFTDVIGLAPDSSLHVEKLLSDRTESRRTAASQGIRKILKLGDQENVPFDLIESVKIGTTVATNALLERKGEPTVLVTNRGFADFLRIAYQNRPDIFARKILLPEQLYERTVELDCRFNASGQELQPIKLQEVSACLNEVFATGIRSCAIVFMHAYKYPAHEKVVAEVAEEIGFTQISTSHVASPLIKMVGRGDTCVADAYLSPVLRRYVEQVQSELPGVQLFFMQSNGGLADSSQFKGKDSLLSGPAGGVVGAVNTCKRSGVDKIISFDMGGTSTDVAHFAGQYEHTTDGAVAGVRIRAPMIAVETVAAGGGSICSFENGRLKVGPESAGSSPGPACYGLGGPITITDCNLLLGRIQPDFFPSVFGQDGHSALSQFCSSSLFHEMSEQIRRELSISMTPQSMAEGFIAIAVEKMANAIKQISIEKGHDLSRYSLAAFGGAAGQHACKIADLLAIEHVVIHPLAGVLSALGIGMSSLKVIQHAAIEQPLAPSLMASLHAQIDTLSERCKEKLRIQTIASEAVVTSALITLRYEGTDFAITVPFTIFEQITRDFNDDHLRRFNFLMHDRMLTVESVSVQAITETHWPEWVYNLPGGSELAQEVALYVEGEWKSVPLWHRADLSQGKEVAGPAIIIDPTSTTVVEIGWSGHLDASNSLILKRVSRDKQTSRPSMEPNPARLELFNHAFMSIAEQMGTALQSTSYSVNIKERLDFSCAIFDSSGALVANAPHIPVHLGSMSDCVKQIVESTQGKLKPGDAYVSNNPYRGGTHLPDITVVSPVFGKDAVEPIFFTASRGHHADIGGISPGSMPANSLTLDDEGIVVDNFLLVSGGQFREPELIELLGQTKFPARQPKQNVADLKAQVAANVKGASALLKLVEEHGLDTVTQYMGLIQDNAESAVRRSLMTLADGAFTCTMDNGACICVAIKIDYPNRSATIDFAGTSPQQKNNFNAPAAIAKAACMYVFRTLIDQDIPLNDGFLIPLTLKIPAGSMLNPVYPAAIVAGNVETSQQITDALYGALNAMAASQGTMNNFTFGNANYQYYETIAGGSGAGPGFDGASAVQTNMTNSRLTDPEVLELRFPVLLEHFGIRGGSGGEGANKGGNGVIRQIKFMDSVTVSILSQRRTVVPFGLNGGEPGSPGANWLLRADGEKIQLGPTATVSISSGDSIIIETPGGGGFGLPAG